MTRVQNLRLFRLTAFWGPATLTLCSFAGVGAAESGSVPPNHLPPVIFECEAATGATSSTCSAWIWREGAYSAVWSIGAIGKITVSAAKDGVISFQRTDSAGLLTGLSGAYTGKFDGASFSDGKVTFSLKGSSNTGIWTGLAEATPVVHTHLGMIQTVIQDEIYGVGRQPPAPYYNLYTADLTAYAVYTARSAGSAVAGTGIEDYRALGEPPMKPGDRRDDSVNLRAPHIPGDYESGAAYRPGMAIAAIYADGTTFGDAKVLAAMIERRRSMIVALTGIGTTLCKLGAHGASVADVETALAKQRAAEDAQSPAGKSGRDAAYEYVTNSLHARGRLNDAQRIKQSWDRQDKLRTGLADPVNDSSGRPAIPAPTAATCRLS
jgi:hypothetical protein